jgi:N-acetylmuramoyl-L-alanine amidase
VQHNWRDLKRQSTAACSARRLQASSALMKSAAIALALFCVICGFSAETRSARVEKVSLSSKEYVRLDQWAKANSLQLKWLAKNEILVSNAATRLHFTTESRRMLLNGVMVLMSESVRNQNGLPLIASIDLNTAIHPVLFPPKNRPQQKLKHICIDAGHGGKDPGEMAGREQEKKYTLLLAQELGAQLRKLGYTVSFTRATDTFIDLPVRPDLARRRGADLFLSLHFNSATTSDSRGVEVYCMTPQRASSTNARREGGNSGAYAGNLSNAKNMLLAYQLDRAIVRGTGAEDRGVKRARYWVLRDAEMPAVLMEGGFMTNPSEARRIFSATWRQQLARSIVTGVENYRKIVER